jgi:hypothetical protein
LKTASVPLVTTPIDEQPSQVCEKSDAGTPQYRRNLLLAFVSARFKTANEVAQTKTAPITTEMSVTGPDQASAAIPVTP